MDSLNIAEQLDIFLITYNRAEYLKNTLSQILDEKSPIKDYTITIIDNNSTDNTEEVISEFQVNHSNLLYKKNKYNIGGNANIARTFEYATKKYIWILCDDDNYNWQSWSDVVKGIQQDADCIIVADCDNPDLGIVELYAQTSFLPATIYKTSNIDETVIDNMQYNIANMFPHMAISSKLINENKKFYIIEKPIIIYNSERNISLKETYTRGIKLEDLHPYRANLSYSAAYSITAKMIKDKNLRRKIIENRKFYSIATSANTIIENDTKYNGSVYNLFVIFDSLGFYYKIKFLIDLLLSNTLYRLVYIYWVKEYKKEESLMITHVMIRLFYLIKTKLFDITRKVNYIK